MANTVNKPRLPLLNLDLQKTTTYVARPYRMTQGDKGYQQPFKLTNAFAPYDVSANNLCFSATKPDNQIIEIENEPSRFVKDGETWLFNLPDEVAQAIGNVSAYFYVKDKQNNIVASTTRFGYEVTAKFGEDIASNSYVTQLELLEKQLQEYIANAKTQANNITTMTNESHQKVDKLLADLQTQTNNWINSKTAEVNKQVKTYTDALSALQTKFNNEYNSQVEKFNSKYSSVNSEWTSLKNSIDSAAKSQKDDINSQWAKQKASIDSDYKAKLSDALAQVSSEKSSLITKINNEWKTQSDKIQSDFTKYLADFTKRIDSASTELADIEKQLPDLQKLLEELKSNISNFNPSEFIKKEDFNKIALEISGISFGEEVAPTQTVKIQGDNKGNYLLNLDDSTTLIQYINALLQFYVSYNQDKSDLSNQIQQNIEYIQNQFSQQIGELSTAIAEGYVTTEDLTNKFHNLLNGQYSSISNGYDLNNLHSNIVYSNGFTPKNAPSGVSQWTYYLAFGDNPTSQFAIEATSSEKVWFRTYSGASPTWAPWVLISNTTTYTNQDIDNKIAAHKPDLTGINNSITDLQNQNRELQSKVTALSNKEYIHVASNLTDAQNYSKAHPEIPVVVVKGS